MLLCPRATMTLPRGEEATWTLQPQALSGPISCFSINTCKEVGMLESRKS